MEDRREKPLAPVQSQPTQRPGCAFWGMWVAASVAGQFVGLLFAAGTSIAVVSAIDRLTGSNLAGVIPALITSLMVIAFMIGISQWLVLRKHIQGAAWWIVVTPVGMGLGSIPLSIILAVLLMGESGSKFVTDTSGLWLVMALAWPIALGTGMGVMQWMVLRRQVRGAGWWVLASAASFTIPLIFTLLLPLVALVAWIQSKYGATSGVEYLYLFGIAAIGIFALTVGIALVWGITGFALVRLLRTSATPDRV